MPQAKGSKARVGYQVESSFGVTPATPALKLLYFNSETFGERQNLITSQVISDGRNPRMPARGNRDVSGSIRTELAPSLGTLFKAALGSVTTTGASAPYTHTFKIGDLPSLTIEKGFTDINRYLLFNGCKVSRMSVSIKPEGYQEATFDFLGANEGQALKYKTQTGNFTVGTVVTGGTSGATGLIVADSDLGTGGFLTLINVTGTFQDDENITDSATGAAKVDGSLGAVTIDPSFDDPGHRPWSGFQVTLVEEGGSPVGSVQAVDLTIDNNIDGNMYVIGKGGVRSALPEGVVKVSGNITVLFEDFRFYQKAINFSKTSLKIQLRHGNGSGTLNNEFIEFFIPELLFDKQTPTIDTPGGMIYRGAFEAFYDNGAGNSALQITLKNSEATV